jgi:hypothetical protein
MLSTVLQHELEKLNRAEKLQVIQLLAEQLAQEEVAHILTAQEYEIWSPHDTPGAAAALQALLDEAAAHE